MSKESNSGISVFQRYLTVWDNQSCGSGDYSRGIDRGSALVNIFWTRISKNYSVTS